MDDGSQPTVASPSKAAWQDWLAAEGTTSRDIWLKIAKQGAAEPAVSYQEALGVALCFGAEGGGAETRARKIAQYVRGFAEHKVIRP